MSQKTPITVAHGNGIGPEIMEASLHIIQAAGAALEIETIEIGEKVYLRGNTAGIDPSSWESLRRTKALYHKVTAAGYDIVKTETLRTFDGQQGFTLAQGQ
jgi:isocitrate/isopropylmalate dehydrogenase